MEIWKEIIIPLGVSIFGGGGAAWLFLELYVKNIAGTLISKSLEEALAIYTTNEELQKERKKLVDEVERKILLELRNYTTKEDMQIERKELLEEVERKYLTLAAFREFEKRIEKNFETIDRRLSDSSKRFDKLDKALEHITDLIIQQR